MQLPDQTFVTFFLRLQSITQGLSRRLDGRAKYAVLSLFTIGYFAATVYRASRKLFWYDEIYTVQMSRLRDPRAIWAALLHGVDFNPPLIYLLTSLSERLAGPGQVGARLPEIVGFWIFCLCLYRFVSVRTNALAGFLALMFPLVTTAYWYAYEARPHGVVLAFCGLALIGWQGAAAKRDGRVGWLLCLSLSLACATLTHTYAVLLFVPIVIGEFTHFLISKRFDYALWLAIVLPGFAVLLSLPLFRALKALLRTEPFHVANVGILARSFESLLGPSAVVVLVVALLLVVIPELLRVQHSWIRRFHSSVPIYEVAAVVALFALPVIAFLIARVTGAPIFDRYYLGTLAGVSCLIAFGLADRPGAALLLLSVLFLRTVFDLKHYQDNITMEELSSRLEISTSHADFDVSYQRMRSDPHRDLPIVLLDNLEFAPSFYYAPADILPRLVYFPLPPSDLLGVGYARLIRYCGARGRIDTVDNFTSQTRQFLVASPSRSYVLLRELRTRGFNVELENIDDSHALFLVTRETGVASAEEHAAQ